MRVSPQKARLVLNLIRGQRAEAARNTLEQTIAATATREFVDALRANAKVSVSEARLDQQQ